MFVSPSLFNFTPAVCARKRVCFPLSCLLLLLAVLAATQTISAQSFSGPTSNVVGGNPNCVAAGDLNGDGKPDLAVANYLNDNVGVLLNNGDGTFMSAVNYPTDLHPQTVTTGDFNNDGKLDLAVGNLHGGAGTGNISVLLGNGNGTFQSAVNYNAMNTDGIVAADLNGDGKLDLIVASSAINSLSVLLGNGNGTFQGVNTYPAGSQPVKVAVADFNGDGKPDLAATNYGASNISILLGNGDGTFQTPTNRSGGSYGIAASDLNVDGKQDLVSVDGGVVVINLGNGNGTFQNPVSYPSNDNSSPPVIADFNGDGKADVAVGNYFGGTVSVLRGNGDGTLQPAIPFPAKPNPTFLAVSDLKPDGKPDLAVASNGTNRVNVLLNSPSLNATNLNGVAGASLSNALVGSFTDYDTTKTAGSFTATIDWGDATTPTSGTVSSNGSGGFNVNATHTYAKENSYHFTVQIADANGNFAAASGTATVADAPLTATGKTISPSVGEAFTALVANFTDADPTGNVGEFSATITWGDGGNSAGTISADGSGGFNVSGSHTYNATGSFPIVVNILDVGGSTATANSTANVTPPALQFSLANYAVNESGGSVLITVNRVGDSSGTASVDYSTSDQGSPTSCATVNGKASSRCDYTTAVGTLRFSAGDTSKTFLVLISQDVFVEGPETIALVLSNVTGAAILGTPSTSTLTISDDATEPTTNPIDDSGNFVRQHYLDFLNREPDPPGFLFWTGEIDNCTPKPQCTEIKRINVSAAFFLSIEFQETGYLVYRFYRSAYGNLAGAPVPLRLNEFLPDTQQIGKGIVVGQTGWEQQLENNKLAFALDFVSRSRFTTAYPTSMTPAQFVDALYLNAGVTPSASERTSVIGEFGSAPNTNDTAARVRVLRRVAENSTLIQQEKNKAFVLAEYFGYLRRNPNDPPEQNLNFDGFNFWLGKLNQFNGNFVEAEMVKAFLVSAEYRQRFGP